MTISLDHYPFLNKEGFKMRFPVGVMCKSATALKSAVLVGHLDAFLLAKGKCRASSSVIARNGFPAELLGLERS